MWFCIHVKHVKIAAENSDQSPVPEDTQMSMASLHSGYLIDTAMFTGQPLSTNFATQSFLHSLLISKYTATFAYTNVLYT